MSLFLNPAFRRLDYPVNAAPRLELPSPAAPPSDVPSSAAPSFEASAGLDWDPDWDSLSSSLLQAVGTHLAATKCALAWVPARPAIDHGDHLELVAIATFSLNQSAQTVATTTVQALPLLESLDVPVSVFETVRLGTPIGLSAATGSSQLITDAYFHGRPLCAVLAVPMVDAERLLGVLYVETPPVNAAVMADRQAWLQSILPPVAAALQAAAR
jgi:GAF domain-containing protein